MGVSHFATGNELVMESFAGLAKGQYARDIGGNVSFDCNGGETAK
jgi:hypothetical protein